MNKQITVKDLLKLCKQAVKEGNGDKNIVISDDNEGNGFHGMFYGFTPVDEYTEELIYDSHTHSPKDTIVLGQEVFMKKIYKLLNEASKPLNELAEIEEKIRKETTQEILREIGEECPIATGGVPIKKFYWFKKICKKHGVEVGEC